MRKLFCLLLVFAMIIPAFAETSEKIDFGVKGHAPTVTGTGADLFNQEIKTAFDKALDEISDRFDNIKYGSPQKFLGAMSSSSAYASHGATTRAYSGYKIFSATVGPMFGFQLPKGISSFIKDGFGDVQDSLKEEGDVNLGMSPNMLNANIGLSMKFIKLDHLYLGVRVGYFNLPNLINNFHYKNYTIGLTANYQIIPSLSLAGLVAWRGLNLGSGFIYNNSKASMIMPLGDPIREEIGNGQGYICMEPKAAMNLTTNTYTIPLEAVTAIKLLIFNIPFGIGADLAFGNTSLGFGVNSDIDLQDLAGGYKQATKGDISVSAGASNKPSFFNFKIMTGFGITAGPVVFDIPLTFYPANKGYSIGLTIGAVF
jgi:hypothetical protein